MSLKLKFYIKVQIKQCSVIVYCVNAVVWIPFYGLTRNRKRAKFLSCGWPTQSKPQSDRKVKRSPDLVGSSNLLNVQSIG